MAKKFLVLFGVIAALSATPVDAGYYETGNDVHAACSESVYGFCLGYAAGLADAVYFNLLSGVCIPNEVQLNQVRDVVIAYLDAHPETRHEPAYYLGRQALIAAWPCPKS